MPGTRARIHSDTDTRTRCSIDEELVKGRPLLRPMRPAIQMLWRIWWNPVATSGLVYKEMI